MAAPPKMIPLNAHNYKAEAGEMQQAGRLLP